MKKHYAISLFSGAGGLDLGVEAAGFTTRLCTDIDDYSCKTLSLNKDLQAQSQQHFLAEATICQRNIKEYPTEEILADAHLFKEDVDLVYGGPPCQAFSVFGKRQGVNDPRGTLVWDYIRVIREIRPKTFLFENVAGLLTIDGGKVFQTLLHELSVTDDGEPCYTLTHDLLNAAEYGIPQYRQRVIIYGVRNDLGKSVTIPRPTHYSNPSAPEEGLLPPKTVGEALRGLPIEPSTTIPNHQGRVHGRAVMDRYAKMAFGERDSKTRINRLDPSRPSYTIVVGSDKGGGKGHVHPYAPREVTPRESARMQTFPDYWVFTGTSRHPIRQVGNAVPPLLGGIVASRLLHDVFEEPDAPTYDGLLRRLGLTYLDEIGGGSTK